MSETTNNIEETLGSEFWTQPEGVLDETFNLMYVQAAQVLRKELSERNGSVIDYLIAERLAFMYAHLRQRESDTENVITDRNRREMLKDWIELATQIKKIWNAEDKDSAGEALLKKVDKAMSSVFDELPDTPENRRLKSSVGKAFEAYGV